MKYIISIWVAILFISCDKSVNEVGFVPYNPTSIDETAGGWKTFVLNDPSEISISVPVLISDPLYKKEIDSLKTIVVTDAQKEAVQYWGAGVVLRWNEIGRELAAKYNIPPAANSSGVYPVPNAADPLADPKFPFANPPYTARALAYLSVVQYDALVAAWKYKFQYKRSAPYVSDASIKPLLPTSTLPSYPSEYAVVSQASYTVLLAMFPGEGPFLKQKLEEAKNVPIWAKINVGSDVIAGLSLGTSVAAKVMARAKTDGMSAANNQTIVPDLISHAKSIGFVNPWMSQEIPARPPMLPNYGAVKTWNFDRPILESIRPEKPYLEGSTEFKKDLEELQNILSNQTRTQASIANYWADGPGSYTPPGHWHRYACQAGFDSKYSEIRMARMLAYVGTALMDAGIACWDTKYFYYSPRPQQFGLKTSVGLPNFPSYTSGHSTFSFAASTVLSAFFPDKTSAFNAYAQEASESRVYGMIHFRIDCSMGSKHGKTIGDFAVKRAKSDGAN
ncbi:phosphatase PAP2 family protein [Aquirufa sp. ROCK2-A2]